jgi:hypothetical protein
MSEAEMYGGLLGVVIVACAYIGAYLYMNNKEY